MCVCSEVMRTAPSLFSMLPNHHTMHSSVLLSHPGNEQGSVCVCRGITPCMVGIIPYAGLDIAAFEAMRERLHERYDGRPPPQHLLLAGMLSSTGAQLVAYPFGLVRTRLQVICPSSSVSL